MKAFAALSLALLVGCSTLGLAPAQSLDEGLAYAEGQVTAAETSLVDPTTGGLVAGVDPLTAKRVVSAGDQITLLIKQARAAEAVGDMTTAQGKLAVITAGVAQLAALLNSGVKK